MSRHDLSMICGANEWLTGGGYWNSSWPTSVQVDVAALQLPICLFISAEDPQNSNKFLLVLNGIQNPPIPNANSMKDILELLDTMWPRTCLQL